MKSIGMDVSKGKSTVCILTPYWEVIKKPFSVTHTKESLNELVYFINTLDGEKRIFMESTGIYHLPVYEHLSKMNSLIFFINPLTMYKYAGINIRPGKTDKLDAITIANYGIDNWFKPLETHETLLPQYNQLRLLSRQYNQYISM